MKLSIRISFLFGIIILVTVVGISAIGVLISHRTLDITILNAIEAENTASAAFLGARLDGELGVVFEIANRARTRTMNWESIQPSLVPDVPRIGALDLALVTPDGTYRTVLENSTVDVKDRDYFKQAMAGKKNIAVVFSRLSSSIVVLFAAPVLANDSANAPVIGVFIARKDGAKTISDITNNIKSSMKSGYSYVVDSDGTIIAHPVSDLVTNQFNPVTAGQTDPAYKSVGEATATALKERNGHSNYFVDGKEMIGYYSEIPGYPWLLFTSVEQEDVNSYSRPMYIALPSIGVIFLLVGLVLAFFLGRAIARPVKRIAATLKDISEGEGDLTKAINVNSHDEIGELARYYNQTQENIKRLILSIRKEATSLSETGADLASNMNESAAAINEITANIKSIKNQVSIQGDSVSTAHGTMEQLVNNIKKLDEHVGNQGSHFIQASTSIEQMVGNIRSVTDTLIKNEDNVKTLTEASEVGRSGLQGVATDIQEIARESEGLLEINAVMKNIASQTNLLSMNAAIEAAHAGEAGKGFAVVADEIRKLAENSSEQSKTIGTVLKKIKESIDKITRSTENVLGKFEAIDSSVRTVAAQEGNIRAAMEEQEIGSKQILEEVDSLKKITKQVTGDSHEMLDGAKEVIEESENLAKSTYEVTTGMSEMASGADQINVAIHHVNEISNKNREGIATLMKEVSQFKVD